jgi:phenylalanyl-tRNA synthetase beta chain
VLAILDEGDLSHLKGVLEALADACALRDKVSFEPAQMPFFTEGRAARLLLDGKLLGVMGETAVAALQPYDLPQPVCMAELDFDLLTDAANLERGFVKLPAFPGAVRDLAVVVDEAMPWAQIESAVRGLNIPILERIEFFDIFRGRQIAEGKKSVAFSLTFRAPDRTLTSEEVEAARQACIQALASIGAQLRG